MPSQRWLTARQARSWRRFERMIARLDARLAQDLARETDLSMADYEVLVNLSEHPDGRMRVFELTAATEWEKSRLSHHLTRMQRRGLVGREECASDARGAYVVLTPGGRAAIDRAAPHHVAHVRRYVVEALSPEQLDALGEISRCVLDRLEAADPGDSA